MKRILAGVAILILSGVMLFGGFSGLAKKAIVNIATSQLQEQGFELTSLVIEELKLSTIHLKEIQFQSPGLYLEGKDIEVVLLPGADFYIAVSQLGIEVSPVDSEQSDDSIGTLLATMEDLIPQLPKHAHIRQLEYCQLGNCLTGELGWQRAGRDLRVFLEVPDQQVWLYLQKDQGWHLDGVIAQAGLDALLDFNVETSLAILSLNQSITARMADSVNVPGGTLTLQSAKLSGVTKVPSASLPSELLTDLISNNNLEVEGVVELSVDSFSTSAQGSLKLKADFSDQDLALTLLTMPDVQLSADGVEAVLQVPANQFCRFSPGLGALDCQLNELVARFDIVHELGSFAGDMDLSQVAASYSVGILDAEGVAKVSVFDVSEGQALIDSSHDFVLRDGQVQLTGAGKLLAGELELSANYDLTTTAGDARVSWQQERDLSVVASYADTKLVLEDLLGNLSGGYQVHSDLSWTIQDGLALAHNTALKLHDVDFAYDGYELKGGEISLVASGYPLVSGEMEVELAQIDVGVPLEALTTAAALSYDVDRGIGVLKGENLSVSVLGGNLRSDGFSYQFKENSGEAVIHMESLQLDQLLALQQQEFDASGLLSGSVPVQFVEGNLSVTNATIEALAPGGFIRYGAEPSVRALAESNAGVGVVLDAMENFEYHTLQASVDYEPDGRMLARTSLKGANPDYQEGREVHLNLNLEENILVLLKSLRLGSDIAEQVGKRQTRSQ